MTSGTLCVSTLRRPFAVWFAARVVAAFLSLILAADGIAKSSAWRLCETGAKAKLDDQIKACSALIATPGLSPQRRAIAHFNRGWAFNLQGRHERAIADFQKASALEPGFAAALRAKGDAYRRKGDMKRAIAEL